MRLIDADRLLERLSKNLEYFEMVISDKGRGIAFGTSLAIDRVNEQPTIDLKSQWIPVAERLPEENVSVLATVSGMPSTNVTLYKTVVIAEYFGNEGWYVEEWPDWEDASPDYWMPLPEPYEPDALRRTNNE